MSVKQINPEHLVEDETAAEEKTWWRMKELLEILTMRQTRSV